MARISKKDIYGVRGEDGFRSGLERQIAAQLTAAGVSIQYETFAVEYVKPQKSHKYTPDFKLPNGIIVESKGYFETADRQKHILVKEQHPELDIRFVFSNPLTRISKTSRTTYADWCTKNGFKFAKGLIPKEWLAEPKAPCRHKNHEFKRVRDNGATFHWQQCTDCGFEFNHGRNDSD